jgi:macrolide-specific efflux system membrane fusion protein
VSPTPTVVNNVVLYDALFDVPNPDRVLMTQMTAQVFFVASAAKDAVLVPVSALRPARRIGASSPSDAASSNRHSGSARSGTSAQAGTDPRTQFAGRRARLSVVGADGRTEEREVQVGVVNRVSAQILSGVEVGEQVATGGSKAPAGAGRGGRPVAPGTGLSPSPSGLGGGPR